jgi:hypothetical protein
VDLKEYLAARLERIRGMVDDLPRIEDAVAERARVELVEDDRETTEVRADALAACSRPERRRCPVWSGSSDAPTRRRGRAPRRASATSARRRPGRFRSSSRRSRTRLRP